MSATDPVVYKRFEVWVYLMQTLKENAFDSLDIFMNFCFGPFKVNSGLPNKALSVSSGSTCPLIWKKAAKVLLEIIGR